jgi:hypothetical protein
VPRSPVAFGNRWRFANATTIAKVGWFLDQRRDALIVSDEHLRVREHRPKQPHYVDGGPGQPGRLLPDWNLIVPELLFRHAWSEVI